jgi:hypothetical protein
MLVCFANIYCPKAYQQAWSFDMYRWISQEKIITKPNIFNGTRNNVRFCVCCLCCCNLLAETNNSDFGVVLISCLVSELQEPPTQGLELRKMFRRFYLFKHLFLVSRNKYAKFRANCFIRSRAISEHTYTHNFNYIYIYIYIWLWIDCEWMIVISPNF